MTDFLLQVIKSVEQSESAWCRYITANDTGTTGSHQAGFYVPKAAAPLFFDTLGVKGQNLERSIKILWQNAFTTDSRIKYYGEGTRNEYRLTRFGRNFPFLTDDNVGNLLIIARANEEEYRGFVMSHDDDIDSFFAYFNLSPGETNRLIKSSQIFQDALNQSLAAYAAKCTSFPTTKTMAEAARLCFNATNNISDRRITLIPDDVILSWVDTEYNLFRRIEESLYSHILQQPFHSIEEFIGTSNEILNRRKSRAGKSLEHHLSKIFSVSGLIFEEQAITEDNKKPDFIFPNSGCYHNFQFPAELLTVLGAKTTCKDRWRQVLTEADRIDRKYLFTLQQGISANQLKEMKDSSLSLVVPKSYISSFPKEYRSDILSLSDFIGCVKTKQDRTPRHFILTN